MTKISLFANPAADGTLFPVPFRYNLQVPATDVLPAATNAARIASTAVSVSRLFCA